jgi:hypothetical protein
MARRSGAVAEPGEDLSSQTDDALNEARRQGTSVANVHERDWQMPAVHCGMNVLWRPSRADAAVGAVAGVVTKIGERSIGVLLFNDLMPTLTPKDGVLHSADPRLARMVENDGGVWDYTLRDKELMVAFESVNVRYLNNDAPDAGE